MALTDSLIGWWDLNGADGTDQHGTNEMTDNNTVGSNTGPSGNAAEFLLANSEYFSHTTNADLQTGDIDFTIAAWLYLYSTPGTVAVGVDDGVNRQYILFYDSGTNTFAFRVWHSTGNFIQSMGSTISLNTWYSVIADYTSATQRISIQANNGAIEIGDLGGAAIAASAEFDIGRRASGSYWDGRIARVGFWKRTLDSTDRTYLYNSGAGRLYSEFGVAVEPITKLFIPRSYRPAPFRPGIGR